MAYSFRQGSKAYHKALRDAGNRIRANAKKRNAVDIIAKAKASQASHTKMEETEVNELSAATLKNYKNKSAMELDKNVHQKLPSTPKEIHKWKKRLHGRKLLKKKLTELSKKTLGNYVKKAHRDTVVATTDFHNTDAFPGDDDKPLKRISKRLKGVRKATDKITKEGNEVNELSNKTLGSYVKKAAGVGAYHGYTVGVARGANKKVAKKIPDLKKVLKRRTGVEKATDKITKEGKEHEKMFSRLAAAKTDHLVNLHKQATDGKKHNALKWINHELKRRNKKEETQMDISNITEKLKVSDGIGKWITDFRQSDAPQFKDKSPEKIRKMAVGAFMNAKNEEFEESFEYSAKVKDNSNKKKRDPNKKDDYEDQMTNGIQKDGELENKGRKGEKDFFKMHGDLNKYKATGKLPPELQFVDEPSVSKATFAAIKSSGKVAPKRHNDSTIGDKNIINPIKQKV